MKQLLLVVTGEFHPIELKNLVADRVGWFNLQTKDPEAPDVRYKTRLDREDTMSIMLEGREEDITGLGTIFARGPLTAHIREATWTYRDAPERGSPSAERRGAPKRRRRRRKRSHNL